VQKKDGKIERWIDTYFGDAGKAGASLAQVLGAGRPLPQSDGIRDEEWVGGRRQTSSRSGVGSGGEVESFEKESLFLVVKVVLLLTGR